MSIQIDLQGSAVAITAGASGIGFSMASRFVDAGADVFVCDYDEEQVGRVNQSRERLTAMVADVSDPDSLANFVEQVSGQTGGRIDAFINNAGIGGPSKQVEDISDAEWDQTIRTNLGGMFYSLKHIVPLMKKQASGSIINISTANARIGLPNRLPYVASKSGVLGFTHNLARELGPYGIRCNAILPGPVDNPRGRRLVTDAAAKRGVDPHVVEQELLKYISLRSWIPPEEIGNLCLFLASPLAAHISGQMIGVCGNTEWEE